MKRILALIICMSMLLGMSYTTFAEEHGIEIPTVIVEGKTIETDELAFIENGKVILPLRKVAEALDAELGWDGKTRSVTIKKDYTEILIKIGKKEANVNGKTVVLDTAPFIKNNRTVVSLNFIVSVLGADLDYNAAEKLIKIKEKVYTGRVSIDYSTGFTIDNLGNDIKIVTDGDGTRLLLVPKTAEIPEGYDGYQVVRTPIDNVLLASATQACALNALGLTDSIAGVTTALESWYIPEVKKGLEDGTIKFVGSSYAPDFELIQELKPELAFVYTGSYPQTTVIDKLKELNIPYVVNNEYMEATSLGRLEWMKFEAAFYNKDDEAKGLFEKAVKDIEAVKAAVKDLESPKVAWGSVYKGIVYVPNAGSYVAEMIESAGGEYVFDKVGVDETGSAKLTLEEFYALAQEVDVLVYSSSYVSSIDDIIDAAPIFAELDVIKEGNVWSYHPSWYQTIDLTADKYIDLANILFPEEIEEAGSSDNYIKLK